MKCERAGEGAVESLHVAARSFADDEKRESRRGFERAGVRAARLSRRPLDGGGPGQPEARPPDGVMNVQRAVDYIEHAARCTFVGGVVLVRPHCSRDTATDHHNGAPPL